ncbi:MAG: hypothetical protein IPP32_08240 [Bacteroidetes bacterium]|nr:hypothetical protein [Bacteroidota bacterium]
MNTSKPFPLYSELSISEILAFDNYAVFLRSDNIIQVQIKDDFDCDVKDAQNILNCIKKLSNGKKYPLLAIYSDFNSFSKEANALVAKHKLTLADALVTNNNFGLKLMAKFYLKINKPVRPTRIFNEVETALVWLKTFNS